MTTRPGEHPAPDDLDALLDAPAGDPLWAHVEGCPQCAGQVQRQQEVRKLLVRHAATPALPAQISERWLEALAREPDRTAPAQQGHRAVDDGPPGLLRLADHRQRGRPGRPVGSSGGNQAVGGGVRNVGHSPQ